MKENYMDALSPILEFYLNNMKISYAITVCNEFVEIQKLVLISS